MTTTYEIDHQGWIIDKNGDKQLGIAMEECAELIQAISKYDRYKDTDARYKVLEEMADVLICMEQLKILCDISDTEIQDEIDYKCKRTEQRYKEDAKVSKAELNDLGGWIPVWERLPHMKDEVYHGDEGDKWQESKVILVCAKVDDECRYGLGQYIKNIDSDFKDGWTGVTYDEYCLDKVPVYAWMPLPKLPTIQYNKEDVDG